MKSAIEIIFEKYHLGTPLEVKEVITNVITETHPLAKTDDEIQGIWTILDQVKNTITERTNVAIASRTDNMVSFVKKKKM